MYQELAEVPQPLSAEFVQENVIRVTSAVRDHAQNIKRTVIKNIVIGPEGEVVASTQYEEAAKTVLSALSPSGRLRALLLESKEGSDLKRRVEIWKGEKLEASLEVTDKHGGFYADEFLGSASFSPDETSFVYTAEAKAPEVSKDPYAKFRFVPHSGEGLVGKKHPVLHVLRWRDSSTSPTDDSKAVALFSLKPSVHASVLFGQAIFGHTQETLYAVGLEYLPDGRLLGIKHCFNRPSGIWELAISSQPELTKDAPQIIEFTPRKITQPDTSCRSPKLLRLDADSSLLVWIANASGGPHAATSSIHSVHVRDSLLGDPKTIVDVVMKPGDDGFPGFYPTGANFTNNAFVLLGPNKEPSIVASSIFGSRSVVLLIPLNGQKPRVLTPADKSWDSWTVLATDGKSRILAVRSSFTIPYQVVLGTLTSEDAVSWNVINKSSISSALEDALSNCLLSVLSIPARSPTETVVLRSKDSTTDTPCITFPHGGPHTTTTTAFFPLVTALALEGYTISLPNYTGSLGFGESAVRALLGSCGALDVGDCIASARRLIELGISSEGPGKQFVSGGSHGGFLTAHLIGKYPDFFSAAALRNPVISASENLTDIPDWGFAEFGLNYPMRSSPAFNFKTNQEGQHPLQQSQQQRSTVPLMTTENFGKIRAMSPITHVDKVKIPVLLLVGASDLRVGPAQGINYYHALKDRGVDVDLLVFEGESHSLEGVEAGRISFESIRDWFAKARSK